MAGETEKVLVLVKATPNWSNSLGKYTVCTAGINENNEWRRLYPMEWKTIKAQEIKVWDLIEVSTTKPDKDPRPDSRKIDNNSVKNLGCAIKNREDKRKFLLEHTDAYIPDATKGKTLSIIKPLLFGFKVDKLDEIEKQVTMDGHVFKTQPFGNLSLVYTFKCGDKGCAMCSRVKKFHNMECFDFGANYLFSKYSDEEVAKEKVRDRCYTLMKAKCDLWFAMGTHSQYPFLKWMIVGLLWMKKAELVNST